jgi:hypothetical protein
MQEALEMYRHRARDLVIKKDIHIHKLKTVISKLEAHMRATL